ncbi:glycosyltransferase, partial [Rhizobium ruizarguesonis]
YSAMKSARALGFATSCQLHHLLGRDLLSFNESPRVLSDCLASLANQDYLGVLRVYVVDDGSRNRDAVVAEQIVYA